MGREKIENRNLARLAKRLGGRYKVEWVEVDILLQINVGNHQR